MGSIWKEATQLRVPSSKKGGQLPSEPSGPVEVKTFSSGPFQHQTQDLENSKLVGISTRETKALHYRWELDNIAGHVYLPSFPPAAPSFLPDGPYTSGTTYIHSLAPSYILGLSLCIEF